MNVTNTGDTPLQHVYVADQLPAGLTYDSSSPISSNIGQNVYWPDIGSLASKREETDLAESYNLWYSVRPSDQ